jgi:hypothetical protein
MSLFLLASSLSARIEIESSHEIQRIRERKERKDRSALLSYKNPRGARKENGEEEGESRRNGSQEASVVVTCMKDDGLAGGRWGSPRWIADPEIHEIERERENDRARRPEKRTKGDSRGFSLPCFLFYFPVRT